MIELILYGFIVWHICCFVVNVVHKDRLTFLRVVRAICISLLFGKVLGEYLYEILGWVEHLGMEASCGDLRRLEMVAQQELINLARIMGVALGATKTECTIF